MWLSRKRFEALEKRVVALEYKLKDQEQPSAVNVKEIKSQIREFLQGQVSKNQH